MTCDVSFEAYLMALLIVRKSWRLTRPRTLRLASVRSRVISAGAIAVVKSKRFR